MVVRVRLMRSVSVKLSSLTPGASLRMLFVPKSATYRLAPSPQRPLGKKNRAEAPRSFSLPKYGYWPAMVLTVNELRLIFRMSALTVSATNKLLPSPHMPIGVSNVAKAPLPSA